MCLNTTFWYYRGVGGWEKKLCLTLELHGEHWSSHEWRDPYVRIFTLQKRIIRIMAGAHPRTLCRRLFKKLEILSVPSQYIYSLMSFFIGNQEKFETNSSVHNINTRNKHHFHRPVANLSCFQKGVSYSGIRIFNSLPEILQILRMIRHSLKKL